MKKMLSLLLLAGAVLLASCHALPKKSSAAKHPPVKLGVEVLFEKRLDLLRGKRVGLITNPTGVDRQLDSIIETFRAHPDFKLVALYGPEHGVRGNAQAGEHVTFYFDEHLKLPVFSLFGKTHKPPPAMLTNIMEYLLQSETNQASRQIYSGLTPAIDVMVFDLQDVGTRAYTFIATMAYAMQACAETGIPFVVLDRPNPINGVAMEGPLLESEHSSFVGLYPIPMRHGMTVGELARLLNDKFLSQKANLTVVPMENWTRDEWFDETGLPWVIPSPNLPTLDSATVYPGQVLIEASNLSEGRGTTRPFELFGAPWIDGYTLAKELNALQLPGVKFRESWFTPTFSKQKDQLCGGCELHVTGRDAYQSVATTLHILQTIQQHYPDKLEFNTRYFGHLMGTDSVLTELTNGVPVEKIVADFKPGLEQFAKDRQPYLLYR